MSGLRAFYVCRTCSDGETRRRRGSLAAQGYLLSLFSFSSSSQKELAAAEEVRRLSEEADEFDVTHHSYLLVGTGTMATGGAKCWNVCRKVEAGSCGAEWTDSD